MNKYRNQQTEVEGLKFASKREALRYQELKLLERAGEIRNLKMQERFRLSVNETKICDYISDFTFEERNGYGWRYVVADAKGYRTPTFLLKKKLMAAIHGIEIREI